MSDEGHQESQCHRGVFSIPGALPIQTMWRDITYEFMRDRIWSVSEGIYRTIFLEGDKGTIAFDTFSTPGGAGAYRGAIQRVFPEKPVHTLVYSHDHLDHTGYAADLAPDAEIVAHDLCARVVGTRKSDGQLPATEIWTGERKEYDIDGLQFELIYPGPTHGDGNVAAYFPQSKILFMVDTVIPGVGYTFFPDWHIAPYVKTMERFMSLDWDLYIPGHFWPLDRAGFTDNLNYYGVMAENAQLAIADGVDVDDLPDVTRYVHEKIGDRFGHLFRFGEYAGTNLARYMHHYLSGGWGVEGNMQADTTPL